MTAMAVPSVCRCEACVALMEYRGTWAQTDMLSRQLSRRGWAGGFAKPEAAWMGAHPPAWYAHLLQMGRRTGKASAIRLAKWREGPRGPST